VRILLAEVIMARQRATKRKPSGTVIAGTGESPDTLAKKASPVAASVNLVGIFIEDCSARRTVEGFTDSEKTQIHVALKEAGIGRPEEEGNTFYVFLSYSLRAYDKLGPEESDPPAVEMTCRFVLAYSIPSFDGISDENLVAFGRTSGVFSAWPYWREFVHMMSLRLSVPPIVLPTYRI
jgi:hypothetical protein